MDSNNVFYSKLSHFQLNKNIIIDFDANNKYIAFVNKNNVIDFYSLDTFNFLFSLDIYLHIIHIKFHPKYYNVFCITLNNCFCIYYINTKENKIEIKCQHICSKDSFLCKTIFSPYNDGKTLAFISFFYINIWRIDNYDLINKIEINIEKDRIFNFQFRWSESGEYLVFPKDNFNIEVFSLSSKTIKFFFTSYANDFYFLEESKQMIIEENKFIYLWDLETKN